MKRIGYLVAVGSIGIALVACGGTAQSGGTATDAASVASSAASTATGGSSVASDTSTSSSIVDASTADSSLVGTWKAAGVQGKGLFITGDVDAYLSGFGMAGDQAMTMLLVLNEDGSCELTYKGVPGTGTYTQTDTGIHVNVKNEAGKTADKDLELHDGVLTIEAGEVKVSFSKDGSYPGAVDYDLSAAKPISNEKDLVGEWELCGVRIQGVNMSGDPKELAKHIKHSDGTASFKEDGSCTMFGIALTYQIDANGVTIGDNSISYRLATLGDNLVIDLSDAMGVEMAAIMSRAQ